jgi:hypothetical protein
MQLINYLDKFPGDRECVRYFRELREIKGVECSHCGSKHHVWNEQLFGFSCLECGNFTALRKGTVMEDSPLSLKYWFLCIYLLTFPEKSYSIEEVRTKLDYLGGEAIDNMLEKIAALMSVSVNPHNFDILLYQCT